LRLWPLCISQLQSGRKQWWTLIWHSCQILNY
jgi:hypothetical protein